MGNNESSTNQNSSSLSRSPQQQNQSGMDWTDVVKGGIAAAALAGSVAMACNMFNKEKSSNEEQFFENSEEEMETYREYVIPNSFRFSDVATNGLSCGVVAQGFTSNSNQSKTKIHERIFWKDIFKFIDSSGVTNSLLADYEKEVKRLEIISIMDKKKIQEPLWSNIAELHIPQGLSEYKTYEKAMENLPLLLEQCKLTELERKDFIEKLNKVIECRKEELNPRSNQKLFYDHTNVIAKWKKMRMAFTKIQTHNLN